jgi:hypothetical protein
VNRLSGSYRTSGPIMATVQPTVVELRAPQVWFPQLKPFTSANGT